MASQKSAKGPRSGEFRRRDGWSGPRDFKSGSSSPGPRKGNYNRSDSPRENREYSQRFNAQYLLDEWRKVEQDLQREPTKDQKITNTVEYIEKHPTDIKADELFDMAQYLKSRREKPSSGE